MNHDLVIKTTNRVVEYSPTRGLLRPRRCAIYLVLRMYFPGRSG